MPRIFINQDYTIKHLKEGINYKVDCFIQGIKQ